VGGMAQLFNALVSVGDYTESPYLNLRDGAMSNQEDRRDTSRVGQDPLAKESGLFSKTVQDGSNRSIP